MSVDVNAIKKWIYENKLSKEVFNEIEKYAKRNQVDILIKNIFTSLEESDLSISWTLDIISSFQQCFTGLHFETNLKIWNIFIQYLKSPDSVNDNTKEFVLTLWNHFLKNITFNQLPEKASLQLVTHLIETQDICVSIIKSSLKKTIGSKCLVGYSLELLKTTGELLLLFPNNSVVMNGCKEKLNLKLHGTANEEFAHSFPDCSFIFPQLKLKLSLKIHDLCSNESIDSQLFISWSKLLLVNLRWLCVMPNVSTMKYARQLSDHLMLQSLEKINLKESNQINNVNSDSSLMYWCLICNSYYYVVEYFSKFNQTENCDVYDKMFAQKLIESKMDGSDAVKYMSNEFFTHWPESGFGCMPQLHHHLSSIVYKEISHILITSNKRKKFKSNDCGQMASRLFQLIHEPVEHFCNVDNQSQLRSCVNSLLSNNIQPNVTSLQQQGNRWWWNESKIDRLCSLLEILSKHTLPFMDVCEKFRCLLAALALLCTCQTPDQHSLSSSLMTQCFTMLNVATHDHKCVQLLCNIIDPSKLFIWLLHYHQHHHHLPVHTALYKNLFTNMMVHVLKSSKFIKQMNVFFTEIQTLMSGKADRCLAFEILVWSSSLVDKALNQHYIKQDCLSLLKTIRKDLLNKAMINIVKYCKKLTTKNKNQLLSMNADDDNDDDDDFEYTIHLQALISVVSSWKVDSKRIMKDEVDGDDESVCMGHEELIVFLKRAIQNVKHSKKVTVVSSSVGFIKELLKQYKEQNKCSQEPTLNDKQTTNQQYVRSHLKEFLLPIWQATTSRLKMELHNNKIINNKSTTTTLNLMHHQTIEHPTVHNVYDLVHIGGLLLVVMDGDQLKMSLKEILHTLDSSSACTTTSTGTWGDIECYLLIWQQLFQLSDINSQHLCDVFYFTSQRILISITSLLSSCTNAQLIVTMLNTLTTFISQGTDFLTIQDVSLLMHLTATINLELYPTKKTNANNLTDHLFDFTSVFKAYYSILNAFLSFHAKSVYSMVPQFMFGVKKLLQASIWAGQQPTTDASNIFALNSQQLNQIEKSALLVTRLANLMTEHKLDFNKAIHYAVAEFVDCLQRVTLYPVVKKALLQAVYKWLDMCNEFTTAQLHTALSPGAREIFKSIYSDYQKYHKFKGRN